MKVSINKEPYENDYAYTLLGLRFGADGTKAKESTETFKSHRIERGTTHHTFKDLKEGYYQAFALFYDAEGNPKTKKLAATVRASDTVQIATDAVAPTTSSIVITNVIPTVSTRGRIALTWTINETPKTIKIVPVQYDNPTSDTGKNVLAPTVVSHRATSALLNGEYEFDSKKHYAVTVVATDDFDIETTGTSKARVQVNTKTPTNLGEYKTQADAATVTSTAGLITFTINNTLIVKYNTTAVLVTIKDKEGKEIAKDNSGMRVKEIALTANKTWNMQPGMYKVSMRAYNVGSGLYSNIKTVTITVTTKAEKTGAPIFNNPFSNTNDERFTITWSAPTNLGKKADGTAALLANDVAYKLYYASGINTADFNTQKEVKAAAVTAQANADDDTAGVETVTKGIMTTMVTGKAFKGKVYVVVEAINSTDTTKVSELSVIQEYSVMIAKNAPGTPVITVTAGKKTFIVNVTALTEGHFGKNTDGDLTAADLTYTFYYAKKGTAINSKLAEAATSDEMYTALRGLADNENDNTTHKGKLILATDAGIGTNKVVTHLAVYKDYYYFVRVEETHDTTNGANTDKSDATKTLSEAAIGSDNAPVITVAQGANAGEIRLTFTDPADWGKRGSGVPVEKKDVTFWLFYLQDDAG